MHFPNIEALLSAYRESLHSEEQARAFYSCLRAMGGGMRRLRSLTWGKSSDRTSDTSSEARVGVKGYSSMCSSSLLASFTRCRLLCTRRAAVCTNGESSLAYAHPCFQLLADVHNNFEMASDQFR